MIRVDNRQKYSRPDFQHLTGLQITVSIGLASFGDDSDNEESLIGNADRKLYQAKSDGRNRAIAA